MTAIKTDRCDECGRLMSYRERHSDSSTCASCEKKSGSMQTPLEVKKDGNAILDLTPSQRLARLAYEEVES